MSLILGKTTSVYFYIKLSFSSKPNLETTWEDYFYDQERAKTKGMEGGKQAPALNCISATQLQTSFQVSVLCLQAQSWYKNITFNMTDKYLNSYSH